MKQLEANNFKDRQIERRQNKQQNYSTALGEWVFDGPYISCLTEGAIQKDWMPAGEFPFCPALEENNNPIENYYNNLKVGEIFYKNQYVYEYKIYDFAKTDDGKTLLVKCEYDHCFRPLVLAKITFENNFYVHSCERYCTEGGIEKYFTIALGKEWTGGEVMDDYC